MEFSEYRSKTLKALWPQVRKFGIENVWRNCKGYRKSEIDNICAINWKNENPVSVCTGVLLDYIQELRK